MAESLSTEIPQDVEGYRLLIEWLDDLKSRSKAGSEWIDAMRWYSLNDLYFFFRHILDIGRQIHRPFNVPIFDHQLYIDMARNTEYQISQGGGLNASSRRIGKSEMRTTAAPLWLLLNNPDISISIVSVEKALALRHLNRIKHELERNKLLTYLFEDLLWIDAQEEARSRSITWSKSEGFVIKGRQANRANSSVEVNALKGGGPVGSGYDVIVGDDIERSDKVGTQAAVDDLDKEFAEMVSLMTPYAIDRPVILLSNTRFSEIGLIHRKHLAYRAKDERLSFEVPAEIVEEEHEWAEKYCYNDDVGPYGGRIVWPFTKDYLFSKWEEVLDKKSEYILQNCLSFRTVGERSLNTDLIHFYEHTPSEKAGEYNIYICVDPSKGRHDPSAIWVWALTPDKKAVWVDGRISNLDITTQRFHDELFAIVSKWGNLAQRVVEVRVEDTPNSDWCSLVERELRARGSWVTVQKVRVHAGQAERKFKSGKHDRIWARWSPALHRGDVWFPMPTSKNGRGLLCDVSGDGQFKDIVDYVLSIEMKPFPGGKHDDGIDAASQLWDEKLNQDFPLQYPSETTAGQPIYGSRRIYGGKTSWMSAG